MKKFLLQLFFTSFFFCGCVKEKTTANECSGNSFAKDVAPIIETHCAITGCHVAGFPPGDFTTYNGLHAVVENGFFQLKVLQQKIMPPADSLCDSDLRVLQCWVDQGALNN